MRPLKRCIDINEKSLSLFVSSHSTATSSFTLNDYSKIFINCRNLSIDECAPLHLLPLHQLETIFLVKLNVPFKRPFTPDLFPLCCNVGRRHHFDFTFVVVVVGRVGLSNKTLPRVHLQGGLRRHLRRWSRPRQMLMQTAKISASPHLR